MAEPMSRCMGCMEPLAAGTSVCPACSYDHSIDNPGDCLTTGSRLGERYLVGRVLHQGDLTTTYLGFDYKKQTKIQIQEFMPRIFASRGQDGRTVAVPPEHQARYKTLLSDIADRWKRLAGVNSRALPKIYELINLHNTVYCIGASRRTITLEEYLDQRGPLDWSETRALMLPVLSAVSQIHNLGLTHCGISPENIVVDSQGRLWLVGFALPELRTAGTDLPPELYAGYSAPEQYSKSQWQGEWTDIYALGAILYRCLVGKEPLSAPRRTKQDQLTPVATQRSNIPANVSEAVGRAMELDKKRRYPSVDQLTAALLEEAGSNTAVFRPDQEKTAPATPQGETPLEFVRKRGGLLASIAINLVLVVAMATGNNFLYQAPAPPEEPPPPPVMEYDLVGLHYPSLPHWEKDLEGLTLRPEYLFQEEIPEGVIYDQSVAPGELLPTDNTIIVWVSRGSRYFPMPDLEGCSQRYALQQLSKLGLEWGTIQQSPDIAVPVGTVVCNVPPGTKMASGDRVILTVRIEGEPTSLPEDSDG